MPTENVQESLRDTIEGVFDSVIPGEGVTDPAPVDIPAKASESVDTQVDDRPRNPDGTFAPKESSAPQVSATKIASPPTPPAVAAGPTRKPSSWKKELETHWGTLAPEVQAEILRREDDYAKGVSTYKGEWDRAKPLLDAIAPFMPELEQHRIAPDKFIANLATAHRTLSLGSPQEKLARFAQLAQEYQIPLDQMFERGQDGQVYMRNFQAPPQQPTLTPQSVEQLVQQKIEQKLIEQSTQHEVQSFQSSKDQNGNPLYPHFEVLKDTMAGLLQAGLADDLSGAYKAALRHPRHAELLEADERSQREALEAKAAAERAQQATRARRNVISTASSTPTATAAANGKKGLRAQLEENFDAATASRV